MSPRNPQESGSSPLDYESAALPLGYPGAQAVTVTYRPHFDSAGPPPYSRTMLSDLGAGRSSLFIASAAVALLAYSAVMLFVEWRWVSGLLGAVVAWLLWRQHPRARFAAYIFLSAVGLRSAMGGSWTAFFFAVALLVLLQTPAAQGAWPRLTWRWSRRPVTASEVREADDRMTRR
jgi:hypothetical protein